MPENKEKIMNPYLYKNYIQFPSLLEETTKILRVMIGKENVNKFLC